MKKTIITIVALLVAGLLFFNLTKEDVKPEDIVRERLDSNISMYPVYAQLEPEEKDIYVDICTAIENYTDSICIGVYETYEEAKDVQNKVTDILKDLFFEQSDYFWADLGGLVIYRDRSGNGNNKVCFEPIYLMGKDEWTEKNEEYNSVIDGIVRNANYENSLFDKVLYVHDYILENTEYYYDLSEGKVEYDLGYTSYGCLVEGKTVCAGYARAFTSIMRRLGIECGFEFDAKADAGFFKNGHVWNYCKLDGEYYYFDLTWDDTIFDEEGCNSYVYFGITKEELDASHLMNEDAITPECNGRKYNYYIYNGYNFDKYDFKEVKLAMLRQSDKECITLRFDTKEELQKAVDDIVTNKGFFSVFPDIKNYMYLTDEYHLHLFID